MNKKTASRSVQCVPVTSESASAAVPCNVSDPAPDQLAPAQLLDQPQLQWLSRHGDMLYAYARQRVQTSEIAEELVQETFLGAIRNCGSFARDSSEETWLIGILRNKLVDHYRLKNRVHSLASLSDAATETGEQMNSDSRTIQSKQVNLDPTLSIEQEELKTVMRDCIDELPDLVRQAFEFRIVEHMETSEVCKLLGISGNNLAARLYRARTYVRDCLTHRWF